MLKSKDIQNSFQADDRIQLPCVVDIHLQHKRI